MLRCWRRHTPPLHPVAGSSASLPRSCSPPAPPHVPPAEYQLLPPAAAASNAEPLAAVEQQLRSPAADPCADDEEQTAALENAGRGGDASGDRLDAHPEPALSAVHADTAPSGPLDAHFCEEDGDGDSSIPGSPAFDDSFAAEAQLILGSLVTPAPFGARAVSSMPGASPMAPAALEQSMQVQGPVNPTAKSCLHSLPQHVLRLPIKMPCMSFSSKLNAACTVMPGGRHSMRALQAAPEGGEAGRRAREAVEEAAADAGLLDSDTQRLVQVRSAQTFKCPAPMHANLNWSPGQACGCAPLALHLGAMLCAALLQHDGKCSSVGEGLRARHGACGGACAQVLAPVLQGAYDDLRSLEAQCAQHAEGEHTLRCAWVLLGCLSL